MVPVLPGARAAAWLAAALALSPLLTAQSRKLSAPLPRLPGRVFEQWITPDVARCVFLASPELEARSLFSVSLTRREKPVALSASVRSDIHPGGVRISTDGARVVFSSGGDLFYVATDGREEVELLAGASATGARIQDWGHELDPGGCHSVFWSQRPGEPIELHSVPLGSSARPTLLGRRLAGQVFPVSGTFAVTPDGTKVVYTADQDARDVQELYCVPIDGSLAAWKVSGPLASNQDVSGFQVSADGTRIVYRADGERDEVFELFGVPVDGSQGPLKLSGTLTPRGDVAWDPLVVTAAGRVLYRADQAADEVHELFSAPLDGSAPPVRLNGTLAARGDVGSFRCTADGLLVVYVAQESADSGPRLHLAPADGSAPAVGLAGPPVLDWASEAFELSPDGRRVAYLASGAGDRLDLYSVPLAPGLSAVRLSSTTPSAWFGFAITPDSTRVVFQSYPDWTGYSELHGGPIDGSSAPVLVDGAYFGDLESFSIAADSRTLLYRADREGMGEIELYRGSLDGAGSTRLSMPLLPGPVMGDAVLAGIGADERAVYTVHGWTWEAAVPAELWSASVRDRSAPRRLFASEVGESLDPVLDPSGAWVVFRVIGFDGAYYRLWTAPSDGRRPATHVEAPGNVEEIAIPAAGPRFAFATHSEVFTVPYDGSESARSVTGSFGRSTSGLEIDPLGTRVVFRAYDSARQVYELFSAPTDGSTAPLVLNGALVRRGSVRDSWLSPRGDRVVYLADQETDEVHELYSVPIDGTTGAVKLSGIQVSGGDVSASILFSPDGARVVYAGDSSADGLLSLYSVPCDGSAAPVELYRPQAAGLDSSGDVRITPDGRRVTFLGDPELDGSFELLTVAIAGGPLRRLNAPLVAGGSVQAGYRIGPDGRTLVYRADQDEDEVFELYSVPASGCRAPVKLNAVLPRGADVEEGFAIRPDGRGVVFAADARASDVVELFTVPIEGGDVPQRLHPKFSRDSDIFPYSGWALQITPDSRRVLFVADADTDEVFELYESPLPQGPRRPRSK